MVSALKAQGATIDKFIGDAVIALWNAPRPNPNHPLGANKHYQTNILASEGLVSRLPPRVIVAQPLDVLVVKGKAKGVRIYEILGRRSEVAPARLEAAQIYEAAFKRYLAMDFEEAARLFRQVLDRLPGYRPAEDFLERCRLFLEEPPSEGWDGSFVLMAK